jgi:hypothetical protein
MPSLQKACIGGVQSGVVTPLNQWIHVASTDPILIGTNRNTNNDEPMVGRLDEVLSYTRALPAGAIDALASDTRPALP